MTRSKVRGIVRFFGLTMAAPIFLACSGGSTSPDPGGGGGGVQTQIASAVATPRNATIARGGSATTTVVYSASSNLTISSFNIQRQYDGISVTQTSNQGSGTNVTKAYSIGADATVPLGTHVVTFFIAVNGATSTVTTTKAEFSLTVN